MGDLSTAVRLAEASEQANRDATNFLVPFAKGYAEFMKSLGDYIHWDTRDNNVDRFIEVEGETFLLRGEEEYFYGEYYAPVMNVPFSYVEDPQAYKNRLLKAKVDKEATVKARNKATAEDRLATARAELAKAEAALQKLG
jgi:hypothetical protein